MFRHWLNVTQIPGFGKVLALAACGLLVAACSPGQNLHPKLTGDASLYQTPTVAVVTEAYVPAYDQPATTGPIAAVLRGGDQVMVKAISPVRETIGGQNDFWFQVESEGLTCWVFGAHLQRFADEIQAKYASEQAHRQLFD